LAGIPDDVIIRAFEILEQIEQEDPFKAAVKANGINEVSGKYHDKFISEKKNELQKINIELSSKQNELLDCEEKLLKKKKELGKKEFELEKVQTLLKQSKKSTIRDLKDKKINKEKSYVQTTFFKPKIMEKALFDEDLREMLKSINEVDINNLTPIMAMKLLMDIKQKAERIDSSNSKM
jgi:DNA mismatch repair ATPase MutS